MISSYFYCFIILKCMTVSCDITDIKLITYKLYIIIKNIVMGVPRGGLGVQPSPSEI